MTPYTKIQIWLYFVCFMIFAMAVIGAVTRLTESGLSMAEWRPVTGWLPPLDEQEWRRVYGLYKEGPEFRHRHYWMDLADFKKIYFWEWLHRLWGRLTGLAYALPLLWLAITKKIPPGYSWKLSGILLLGGAQGLLGWWMVTSGLSERPDVSHYRLAAHLALALILFGLVWWMALDIDGRRPVIGDRKTLRPQPSTDHRPPYALQLGWSALILLATAITWGAFTAGLDAGKIYNTWPLMDGSFLPAADFGPAVIFEQHGWVQFTHRWLAVMTGLLVLFFAWGVKDAALAAMVFIQICLGIAIVLTQAPVALAALHQAGAIILLALLLGALHQLTGKPE